MALQASSPRSDGAARAGVYSRELFQRAETRHWWYVDGHLYEVFLQDIYFGPASGQQVLGYLVLGYEIDDRVAREVSQVAASEVAFRYGRHGCAEHAEAVAGRGTAARLQNPSTVAG